MAAPSREDGLRLVAVGGLVASGKSSVARAIAKCLGSTYIEADHVRHELLDRPPKSVHEARWVRDLEPGFTGRVYHELLRRGRAELARGRSVVLDACFPTAVLREAAKQLAVDAGVHFCFVECRVPKALTLERLRARDRAAGREGWAALYHELEDHFEPPGELAEEELLVVRTDEGVERALRSLEGVLLPASRSRAATRLPTEVIEPRPRALTFDCWNTLLVEEDWPHAHALRVASLHAAAAEAGCDVSDDEAGRAFDQAWSRHLTLWGVGVASGSSEIAAWGLEALGLKVSDEVLAHLVRRFEDASHTSHVTALQGSRELLGALVAAGIPCALVCDTGLTPGWKVRELLERTGLLPALSVQIFSDEVGVPKPDARAFLAALEPLGVAPAQALHVGDLRRTDVAGAHGVGMQAARIRDRYDDTSDFPDAEHVVGTHAELQALLGLTPGGVLGS